MKDIYQLQRVLEVDVVVSGAVRDFEHDRGHAGARTGTCASADTSADTSTTSTSSTSSKASPSTGNSTSSRTSPHLRRIPAHPPDDGRLTVAVRIVLGRGHEALGVVGVV